MITPFSQDFYFIVKTHIITLSDLEDIFFKGEYPNLIIDLAKRNYQLYLVSTKGIDNSANNFISQMRSVFYLHADDLILQSSDLLLDNNLVIAQVVKHILPTYCHLLPSNWKDTLKVPRLKPAPELIYNGKYPLGVVHEHKNKPSYKPFRARFRHGGRTYSFGYHNTPEEAGIVVREKMLEIKGYYSN